ncbi:MAG: type III-A CRISPR-associated RAMP protein Csm3 [Armatimonadota bacterium]|nr:type III-A CRISPR-associated RAMP protein Csm3 [Armatimonadota bacterium]
MSRSVPAFLGKVALSAEIVALTGLRIGAAASGLDIGGVDQPVLRDPVTNQPYIPGSSLKGKLRSLLTKAHGLPLQQLVQRPVEVWLHWCTDEAGYRACMVCPTFGQFPSGPRGARFDFVSPARLITRDARLGPELQVAEDGRVSRRSWKEVDTDLPFSEVKVEVALDVITAASNPRQMERVPPGAIFESEVLFTVFRPDGQSIDGEMEKKRLREVIAAMRLLEDDYLGSSGTRGYGKVKFQKVQVSWRPIEYYRNPSATPQQLLWQGDDLAELLSAYEDKVAARVWG